MPRRVVSRINSAGGKAQAIQADVSCEADVLAMFHEIEGQAWIFW